MKIALFDPGIEDNLGTQSSNLGDLIIQSAVDRELRRLFGNIDPLRISTQTPMNGAQFRSLKGCDYLFVGGTNLLASKMRHYKQWQIGWLDARRIRRAILLGVGWWQYQDDPDWYTRSVLRHALSPSFQHSVRDAYTQRKLASIGIVNTINTGCPTMWPLAGFNFGSLPSTRSEDVLTMITDYARKPELDLKLLELLKKKYRKVYFWPQGRRDMEYMTSLGISVEALGHSFGALKEFLQSSLPFDYVGTRLHGGVYALLAGRRSLVIEIDNRAAEIARDTSFPTVARGDLDSVLRWIENPTKINIRIDTAAVEAWRGQFQTGNVT